jgi:hypothetical protein
LLTLADLERSVPPNDDHSGLRILDSKVDLAGPNGIPFVATVHKSADDGDLLRIFRAVGDGYRLARQFEDQGGDGPSTSGYERPEGFRLRDEFFVHVMLQTFGTGNFHQDTILWIAPDGSLHDVTFVAPATIYKNRLRKGEGIWKGEVNQFTFSGASFGFWIWRNGDANCCPSGSEVTGEYRLLGAKRFDAATKRWSANFRIEPANFERNAVR